MGNNHVFNTGYKVCYYLTCAAVQRVVESDLEFQNPENRRVDYLVEAMEKESFHT